MSTLCRSETQVTTSVTMERAAPPSLRAGNGLPGRQVVLCDGRTSLRADQSSNGFDLLTHYAPDSWVKLARVLTAPDCALTWAVDDGPHVFEWTDVFPFGMTNLESRAEGEVRSTVAVSQGMVRFDIAGVKESAALKVPVAMFRGYDDAGPHGEVHSAAQWQFGQSDGTSWTAQRSEQWLFRDMSTFADVTGRTVASEERASKLFVTIRTATSHRVEQHDGSFVFHVTPNEDGAVCLVIGLGGDSDRADANSFNALNENLFEQQHRRYAELSKNAPTIAFGRHTAMRQFSDTFPGYLESMRIADDPAVFRANNDYYWVWGWDMTRPAFGLLCAGRHAQIRDLLLHRARDGYISEYDSTLSRNLRWVDGKPGALEFMLAHDYAAWSGDFDGIRPVHDSFAQVIREAYDTAGPTGMFAGDAASSDFPQEFGRTFKAWLAYHVGWSYGGYMGVEKLLRAWGDADTADKACDLALRVRRNFKRIFWNERTGFWNEGVHPTDPDLVCDIPLSTALSGMDSIYGEDLYGDKLDASAQFAREQFLREDGVHIVRRGEVRGWKEWTRQPNNWFAANDTMLARLFRATGDIESLEQLFYLYEINFGYQPAAFEGKPFRRPLHTSGSWQAFGAGAWYRNLVEAGAGLWADLGGLTLRPSGLGEPMNLRGLRYRDAVVDFSAQGQGQWPASLTLDGQPIVGTTKLPPLESGRHELQVTYGPAAPDTPLLTLATDAVVTDARAQNGWLRAKLTGDGYTAITFYAPGEPNVTLDDKPIQSNWNEVTGCGRASFVLSQQAELGIQC